MEPTPELIDSIYIEKVRRARVTPIERKLVAGPRLFAYACEASRAGIRAQNPNATSEQVEQLLRSRLRLHQRLEEARRG
jgi:hypothetical protein